MDYEQRHKEVLDAIKKLQEANPSDDGIQNWVNENFPELAESEDEKIRKELIDFLWKEKIFLQEAHSSVENNPKYRFVMDAIAWLEKQGEQILANSAKTCKDEQKSANKVEPKFKVGDWVRAISSGNIFKILSVNDGLYRVLCYDGVEANYPIEEVEKDLTYWTIQDAKDGDVLVDSCADFKNPLIFILKKFEHKYFGLAKLSDYSSYCFLTMSNKQDFKEGSYHHIHNIHPAAKEQRDLLFQKMKEAGYQWDAEKKELLEIEEELTDFEKSLKHIMIETLECGDTRNLKADAEMLLRLAQEPKEWSEEDEDDLNNIIWLCNNCIRKCELTWTPSQATRIKSLIERIKDIVFVQPKQQWSEEDEKKIDRAIWLIDHYATHGHDKKLREDVISGLESLKRK